ncbi:MAG: porin [Gemmatimonadaceae bacterium]|nr:porin [Gemmatimonadaceae bacterium]MCW5825682.1 porin [Gemmatimonadaceae bacterium]
MPARLLATACFVFAFIVPARAAAQAGTPDSVRRAQERQRLPDAPAPWYERLAWRGYAQIRYNRLFETNPDLNCAQCDRSIGNNGGFFVRRGRLILFGNVHPRVYIYVQPDYGSDAAGNLHYFQLRDAYFDLYLDESRAHRLRFGQSKVPFGFENLQSSQNRIPLDRHDGMNSAVANERDLGVIYYWSPPQAAERFRSLLSRGLKGSGDYGVFGFGLYNGQTANRPEANNSSHAVARLTYPWRLKSGQFVETSVQGYTGRVVPPARTAGVTGPREFVDERAAATLVVYPQPLGIVAEYGFGRGPEFDPGANAITSQRLEGGFVQLMYRAQRGEQVFIPFLRLHRYDGGKKVEQDARSYDVHEFEAGVEWSPIPNFELAVQYTTSNRRFEDAATVGNRQKGQFLRIQAQFNY